MMQFLGPVANLASSWLQGKAAANAANAKLKLTEAEAKAKILLSKETSTADWEKIMAQGTQNSWKDEAVTILVLAPVCLCFIPGLEQTVQNGFERLAALPQWYTNLVLVVCLSAIGIRGGKQFFGVKK